MVRDRAHHRYAPDRGHCWPQQRAWIHQSPRRLLAPRLNITHCQKSTAAPSTPNSRSAHSGQNTELILHVQVSPPVVRPGSRCRAAAGRAVGTGQRVFRHTDKVAHYRVNAFLDDASQPPSRPKRLSSAATVLSIGTPQNRTGQLSLYAVPTYKSSHAGTLASLPPPRHLPHTRDLRSDWAMHRGMRRRHARPASAPPPLGSAPHGGPSA